MGGTYGRLVAIEDFAGGLLACGFFAVRALAIVVL